MSYLKRHAPLKADPNNIINGVKSILCFGAVYNPDAPYSVNEKDPDRLFISRYALNCDYHNILRKKLYHIMYEVKTKFKLDFNFRICIDSAPLLERSYSVDAGLGWIGKNGCLINKELGSFIFLSEVLIDVSIPADKPYESNYCGNCRRCIDACPTGAIINDGVIDATKCISYLTIENKVEIPPEMIDKANGFIFGCDVCQEVCPYNREAPLTRIDEFKPRPEIANMDRLDYETMDKDNFIRIFRKNPVKRTGFEGLKRNIRWNSNKI
jgi:epoxyqueuosine reductase